MFILGSFADINQDGKNIGACMFECKDTECELDVCKQLGLMPSGNINYRFYVVDPEQESMELNKFYTPEEARALGYKSTRDCESNHEKNFDTLYEEPE